MTKGSELEFISKINRDGSGTEKVSEGEQKILMNEWLRVQPLSLSLKTCIAVKFNSYVVKFKQPI